MMKSRLMLHCSTPGRVTLRLSYSLLVAVSALLTSTARAQGDSAITSNDTRIGLHAGLENAGEAARNLVLIGHVDRPQNFGNPQNPADFGFLNADLAFMGNYVYQGGFNGFQIWDVSNPNSPKLRTSMVCPGGQGDLSVYKNLMFMSVEETRGRLDCGAQGVSDTVSAERFRGIRIFDMTDIDHPKQVADVQTCRGSHTHTLVTDPRDPANPKRIAAVIDPNFAYWHSATFNNEGTKVLFTDEWGGGMAPRCRATDKMTWGADAIFYRAGNNLNLAGYYKLPVAQTEQENCVAHNGSLIPIPGRDIMAQAWYQGGVSVFDFTDPSHPKEIAFFDRGPMDSTKLMLGGDWAAYWYNGHLYASEIDRGLDVLDLKPSDELSQNEIDAAKLIHFDVFNPQNQPKLVWPVSFVVARAYLDQLVRGNGISSARSTPIARDLNRAERLKGASQRAALNHLAARLDQASRTAADPSRVEALAASVRDLAK